MSSTEAQSELRFGRIEISRGKPVQFTELDQQPDIDLSSDERRLLDQIGACLKAYRREAQRLLNGEFAELRGYAPTHLFGPTDITAICCSDGILVRFDSVESQDERVRVCKASEGLAAISPMASEAYLYLSGDAHTHAATQQGPSVEIGINNPSTGESHTLRKFWPTVCASVVADERLVLPPPHKPPCLISITNEIELLLDGVAACDDSASNALSREKKFLIKAPVKLPTGWSAIEVFTPFEDRYWREEFASIWARTDLLAAIARNQLNISKFAAIDPNAAARKSFQTLLSKLTELLQGSEEPAHQFLKANPVLLSPTHLQCWSKFRFGDRVSDFILREPNDEFVLVEIESPLREVFRKDGQQREELTHAWNQILDWRLFLEAHLDEVRTRLGSRGISTNPRSLIVIGRSDGLSDANRSKISAIQSQTPGLQILTYDDLIERAKTMASNLFGPIGFEGANAEIYFRQE